jgi:catechol 2,3-dioxygenase-like lactoylglutathione lyase family enzyme
VKAGGVQRSVSSHDEGQRMNEQLDGLLNQYEQGHLTRRDLLLGMTALMAASSAAPAQTAVGTVKQLNHVTIFVPDVQKSVRFYQDLLGLKVLTTQGAGINLAAGGGGFLGIYPARNASSGSINHFCFGIENFDAKQMQQRLAERGVKANIRMRGDTPELYFNDNDGISVQLQHEKYKGGVGVLGDRDP